MDASPYLALQVVASSVHLEVRARPGHPSVVTLGTERMGSETLVAEDLVLTVNDVTLGAAAVTVTGPRGRRATGEVVARDFDSGLALVKVPRGLGPPVPLGEGGVPGQPVFLLASTSPTARRVRPGLLTEVGPFNAAWEYMLEKALKVSAVNPGFGGGALCDGKGWLLGVASQNLTEVARATLAVPVDLYRRQRDELLRHGRVPSRPARAWLGLFSEETAGGLRVVVVIPGSPAARAGVLEGDLLIGLDVIRLTSRREFYSELWKRHPRAMEDPWPRIRSAPACWRVSAASVVPPSPTPSRPSTAGRARRASCGPGSGACSRISPRSSDTQARPASWRSGHPTRHIASTPSGGGTTS